MNNTILASNSKHNYQYWTLKQFHQVFSESCLVVDPLTFFKEHVAFAKELDAQLHLFASLEEHLMDVQVDRRVKNIAKTTTNNTNKGQHHHALLGRLYGVPIAIKDIFDTADFPTCYGSPNFFYSGRYSSTGDDAVVVRHLREEGAIIYGKTVTTEFATMTPAATRNPHNLEHTPGGSSSGSAAAVAAGVVPVALGSQTNGSVIRPASFCGVYGFKPTRGVLSTRGMLEQSKSLDQVGILARNMDDLVLVADIILLSSHKLAVAEGEEEEDNDGGGTTHEDDGCTTHDDNLVSLLTAVKGKNATLDPSNTTAVLSRPKFCFLRTPWWERMELEAQEACNAFLEVMDGIVEVVELESKSDLSCMMEQTIHWHAIVNDAEMLHSLHYEFHNRVDELSPLLRQRLEAAKNISAVEYLSARERMPHVARAFDVFLDCYDAILTPSALGAAPKGFETTTGDPILQTVWTFAGLPVLGMPLLSAAGGLPLGVQAIGRAHGDGQLLRSCTWLVHAFEERQERRDAVVSS